MDSVYSLNDIRDDQVPPHDFWPIVKNDSFTFIPPHHLIDDAPLFTHGTVVVFVAITIACGGKSYSSAYRQ